MNAGLASIGRTRAGFRKRMDEINTMLTSDATALGRLMQEWGDLAKQDVMIGVVEAIFAAFAELVRRTPVDTGRARNAWQVSAEPTEYTPSSIDYPNKNDIAAIVSKATEGIPKDAIDVVYITNNVEYIMALEAGWSKHQAGGFIGLFIQDLKSAFERLGMSA